MESDPLIAVDVSYTVVKAVKVYDLIVTVNPEIDADMHRKDMRAESPAEPYLSALSI